MSGNLRELLDASVSTPSEPNEVWYVVSLRFIRDGGRILNLQLLASPTAEATELTPLKNELNQGLDYDVYPENVWQQVSNTSGYDVAIPRKVYRSPTGSLKVEIQPISLSVTVGFSDQNSCYAGEVYGSSIVLNGQFRSKDLRGLEAIIERSLDPDSEYSFRAEFTRRVTHNIFISRTTTWEQFDSMISDKFDLENSPNLVSSSCTLISDNIENSYAQDEYYDESDPVCEKWYSITRTSPTNSAFTDLCARQEAAPDFGSAALFVWLPIAPLRILNLAATTSTACHLSTQDLLDSFLPTGGLTGLNNLGNTCFMNSAVQCLSHTLPLTRYYLSNQYLDELNVTNPLGMKGVLAKAYANFLAKFWNPNTTTLAPTVLKSVIGKFAPNFQGYAQQDSQELLGFLLDGLHEDNNRIKDKPYTEAVEGTDSENDHTIADEAWKRHKLRNDSIIVDLFQGQYRSRLECPICGHVSKTFDPFLTCSLPVPHTTKFALYVNVFLWRGQVYPISCILIIDHRSDLSPMRLFSPRLKPNVEFLNSVLETEETQIRSKLAQHLHENREKIKKEFQDHITNVNISMDDLDLCIWWSRIDDHTDGPISGDDRFCHLVAYPRNTTLLSVTVPLPGGITLRTCSLTLNNSSLSMSAPTSPSGLLYPNESIGAITTGSASASPISSPYPSTGGPVPIRSEASVSSITLLMISDEDWSTDTIVLNTSRLICANLDCTIPTNERESSWTASAMAIDERGYPTSLEEVPTRCHVQLRDTGGFWQSRMKYLSGNRDTRSIFLNGKMWKTLDIGCYGGILECSSTMTGVLVPLYNAGRNNYGKFESACIAGLQGDKTTLYDCFSAFVEAENLEEDNKWYCGKCKDFVCANKKMDFWRLPKILVVHLKRFQLKKHIRSKICTAVEFPWRDDEILDLSQLTRHTKMTGSSKYKLFGVSEHYGGLGGGHYTATVRCKVGDRAPMWHTFDDTRVSVMRSAGESMYESGYILFYEAI